MKTVLITGSNKGIGFETARQFGNNGFHVILSGRDEARVNEALQKLKSESISAEALLMDVSDAQSITSAAQQLSSKKVKLDVLINNAAILLKEDQSLSRQKEEIFTKTITANCYGPLHVTQALLPLLHKGSKVINLSSGGGSMTDAVGGWSPAYCVSKTMLNMITRQLANELSSQGVTVNAVCPGWVRTDMGGKSAPRSVEQGAATQLWLATEAPASLTGKFFRDKKEIPW